MFFIIALSLQHILIFFGGLIVGELAMLVTLAFCLAASGNKNITDTPINPRSDEIIRLLGR